MFFQFNESPLHFNQANVNQLENTAYEAQYQDLEVKHNQNFVEKQAAIRQLVAAINQNDEQAIQSAQTSVSGLMDEEKSLRNEVKTIIKANNPDADTEDTDYVFINFVTRHLPMGLVGLLLAVIFSAAMSSALKSFHPAT